MDKRKHIGMDVHKEAISIAVLNSAGKPVMESTIETKASTILQFFQGLSGSVQVTFEEGTWAAWLYDLLKPHVTQLLVCNPRKNALLKQGSKSDRIDARKLAELLRNRSLSAVESIFLWKSILTVRIYGLQCRNIRSIVVPQVPAHQLRYPFSVN